MINCNRPAPVYDRLGYYNGTGSLHRPSKKTVVFRHEYKIQRTYLLFITLRINVSLDLFRNVLNNIFNIPVSNSKYFNVINVRVMQPFQNHTEISIPTNPRYIKNILTLKLQHSSPRRIIECNLNINISSILFFVYR